MRMLACDQLVQDSSRSWSYQREPAARLAVPYHQHHMMVRADPAVPLRFCCSWNSRYAGTCCCASQYLQAAIGQHAAPDQPMQRRAKPCYNLFTSRPNCQLSNIYKCCCSTCNQSANSMNDYCRPLSCCSAALCNLRSSTSSSSSSSSPCVWQLLLQCALCSLC
jgi:hypothetical protein